MDDTNFTIYNLSNPITEALNGLGYVTPTKVQDRVIPFVLQKNDLIVKRRQAVERPQHLQSQSVN